MRKCCFGFCLWVESGNAKLNGTNITGYINASFRFTSSRQHYLKFLPIFFHGWNCFQNLFCFLQSYVKINLFNLVKKVSFFSIRQSFTSDKCISSPILSALINILVAFFSNSFPVAISQYISNIYIIWKNKIKIKILLMYLVPGMIKSLQKIHLEVLNKKK